MSRSQGIFVNQSMKVEKVSDLVLQIANISSTCCIQSEEGEVSKKGFFSNMVGGLCVHYQEIWTLPHSHALYHYEFNFPEVLK